MITTLLLWATTAVGAEVSWTGGGHAANPQWSADGSWLAFEVNNNADKVDLYVVKVQGGLPGTPVKVAIPGGTSSFSTRGSYAANPNWHPRQNILIFEAANSGGTTRLYYLNPGTASPAEYLSINQARGDLAWPTISSDGQQLAFTSSATGAGDIYLFSPQSNQVTPAFPTSREAENAPRFAATGQLVFSRKNFGTEDLFTGRPGDATQPPLKGGGGAGDQTRPRVVSGMVVYYSNERGDEHWDIAIVPLAGGDRKVIARDVRLPQRAAPPLTPDGGAVLFASASPEQDGSVFAVRLDGSGTREFKTGMNAVGDPVLTVVNGRSLLGFTALPSAGSDWRQLHVVDVTGQL